jgi:hypothetical protein
MTLFHKTALSALLLTPLAASTCPLPLAAPPVLAASADTVEAAGASLLSGERLPSNAIRLRSGNILSEMHTALAKVVAAAGPQARQGGTEVLTWTSTNYKKSQANLIMSEAHGILRAGGWSLDSHSIEGGLMVVTARRETPAPRALVGLWVPQDEALVLAWTEVLSAGDQAPDTPSKPEVPNDEEEQDSAPQRGGGAPSATPKGATVLEVGAEDEFVEVMQGGAPPMPSFRRIEKKPGLLRGLVKDASGKPLKGAKVTVASTAIGGAETFVTASSDAQGLYEVELPLGACEVRAAAHTQTFNGVLCALPLHPADGEFDGFASRKGEVENLVLLPYGIANAAGAAQYPQVETNYYGGSISIIYDSGPAEGWLPVGRTLEISLSPRGPMLGGRAGRSFVIRHRVQQGTARTFKVNNIPAGSYAISARLTGGAAQPLLVEEYLTTSMPGGLKPKRGSTSPTFFPRPKNADAAGVVRLISGWNNVPISIKSGQ